MCGRRSGGVQRGVPVEYSLRRDLRVTLDTLLTSQKGVTLRQQGESKSLCLRGRAGEVERHKEGHRDIRRSRAVDGCSVRTGGGVVPVRGTPVPEPEQTCDDSGSVEIVTDRVQSVGHKHLTYFLPFPPFHHFYRWNPTIPTHVLRLPRHLSEPSPPPSLRQGPTHVSLLLGGYPVSSSDTVLHRPSSRGPRHHRRPTDTRPWRSVTFVPVSHFV